MRIFPGTNRQRTASGSRSTHTRVAIVDGKWHINGQVTYRGAAAEGLLMNVRMVNCVFEDTNREGFDPEANTNAFIARIPDYAAHGVRAFTVCLQGGFPGYEGAVNSAFSPDGSLRETYFRRAERVIEACARNGVVVILGCYYQRQDQVLRDEAAVRAGAINVARRIEAGGHENVLLEIANEFPHGGFGHRVLRTPGGQVTLLRAVKQTAPGLLVSTSGLGNGKLPDAVARECDFLLIHFNGTRLDDIGERIAALKRFGKPIVCNEDEKVGHKGAKAAELCVDKGASWGFMLLGRNQTFPFVFQGAKDDPAVYAKLGELAAQR